MLGIVEGDVDGAHLYTSRFYGTLLVFVAIVLAASLRTEVYTMR